jgi:mono/diheme cytochrome c family protein
MLAGFALVSMSGRTWSGRTGKAARGPVTAILTAAWLLVPLSPTAARADEISHGEELAERLCAVCHLNPGQGDKTGPSTVPSFVAVAKRPGQTLDGIISWLRSVPPMMPDHHLSQDEMEALAFYILSLRDVPDKAPLD